MKNILKSLAIAGVAVVSFNSCKKDAKDIQQDEISKETLTQIQNLGFYNKNVQKVEEGYLVEGDIILTENDLRSTAKVNALRVGTSEQYRTTNLVKALPRVITISVSSQLGSKYVSATDEAINRYNAENLLITFQRIASGGNIQIVKAGGNFLASAGFPTSSGNPYGQIKVNATQLNGQPLSTVASVLAHEIGHCIGFRHTDYMDRSYSCGGGYANEGASSVGAIHISGTPTGPDPNSWMLACIGSGQNRPFNANDKTALGYLY